MRLFACKTKYISAKMGSILKEKFGDTIVPASEPGSDKILQKPCPVDIVESACLPVTLYHYDGSLMKKVPAGGSETLLPVTIYLADGSELQKKNGESFTVTETTPDPIGIYAEDRDGDPDVLIDEVDGGDTFTVPAINIIDEDDTLYDKLYFGEQLKLDHPSSELSKSVSGSTLTIIVSKPGVVKPMPISIQPPSSGGSSVYSGDFIDLYSSGKFDFYDYTGLTSIKLIDSLSSDPYTLTTGCVNDFGGTERYTTTDGLGPNGSLGSLYFLSWGSGLTNITLDWKHRLMWYQANIGGVYNHPGALSAVSSINSLGTIGGFNDWFIPPIEYIMASAYPNPSQNYYSNNNMFRRGLVSGTNESIFWDCRVCELSPGNSMSFFAAYDYRRQTSTSALNKSAYICRFIQPTDSFLP